MLYGVTVSTSDSGSEGGGSNPSGAVYMEFVAEWFRRKFVALVYAGSNPVKLPLLDVVLNGSIRGLGPCGVSSNLAIQTKRLLLWHQNLRRSLFVKRSSEWQ